MLFDFEFNNFCKFSKCQASKQLVNHKSMMGILEYMNTYTCIHMNVCIRCLDCELRFRMIQSDSGGVGNEMYRIIEAEIPIMKIKQRSLQTHRVNSNSIK